MTILQLECVIAMGQIDVKRPYFEVRKGKIVPISASTRRRRGLGGNIYVALMNDGVVKVGCSQGKRFRVSKLNPSKAKVFNIDEYQQPIFKVEREVLKAVRPQFRLVKGNEWFEGDFDEICSLVDMKLASMGLFPEII